MTQYWGGTRHFFLLTLYNFKNIRGGHVPPPPPPPPTPRSVIEEYSLDVALLIHLMTSHKLIG